MIPVFQTILADPERADGHLAQLRSRTMSGII